MQKLLDVVDGELLNFHQSLRREQKHAKALSSPFETSTFVTKRKPLASISTSQFATQLWFSLGSREPS